MKMNGYWLSGLMLVMILMFFLSRTGETPLSGKYHPKDPIQNQTDTITVLNPALFHRLNTILEHGLIQGD